MLIVQAEGRMNDPGFMEVRLVVIKTHPFLCSPIEQEIIPTLPGIVLGTGGKEGRKEGGRI